MLALTLLSFSAEGQTLIRDAETENFLLGWTQKLAKAAGLRPGDIRIHIIRNPRLNAFVTRGQRIFITTGLLMKARHPEEVIGVLAHELGHISGGHLARLQGAMQDAAGQAMIGMLVGTALGALSGRWEVAVAAGTKAQDLAGKQLAKHTRTQERSADQISVDILDRVGISSRGILSFMEKLERLELLHRSRQEDYMRSHPVTRQRIEFFRKHHDESPVSGNRMPASAIQQFDRVRAKLSGFLTPPPQTLRRISASETSAPARYTRAIAFYRDARIDAALPVIDGLLREFPEDPYFWELRGQMLFENGRLEPALAAYRKAVEIRPGEVLFLVALAHVQIELARPELLAEALENLKQAVRKDRAMPLAWQLLAIAYGRSGEYGMSALASAERNLLSGHFRDARDQVIRARNLLPTGSPGRLRAEDLLTHINRLIRRIR